MEIQASTNGALDPTRSVATALAASRESAEADAAAKAGRGESVEAAEAFEKLFATLLVRELRKGLPEGLFSGAGSDVYSGWFDEHVGGALARGDALGLTRMVQADVERTIEKAEAEAEKDEQGETL